MKKLFLSLTLGSSFLLQSTLVNAASLDGRYQGEASLTLTYAKLAYKEGTSPIEQIKAVSQSAFRETGPMAIVIIPLGLGFMAIYTAFTLGSPIYDGLDLIPHDENIDSKVKANIQTLGEDKLEVLVEFNKSHKCKGAKARIIGEADGFNGYKLFASTEDYSNGKSIGSLYQTIDGTQLTISNMKIITKGKKNTDCVWGLEKETQINLTRSQQEQ
ncbi:MAG: hypothetical protein AB7I27_09825 [Bacteriovoracaceae bacterium]